MLFATSRDKQISDFPCLAVCASGETLLSWLGWQRRQRFRNTAQQDTADTVEPLQRQVVCSALLQRCLTAASGDAVAVASLVALADAAGHGLIQTLL